MRLHRHLAFEPLEDRRLLAAAPFITISPDPLPDNQQATIGVAIPGGANDDSVTVQVGDQSPQSATPEGVSTLGLNGTGGGVFTSLTLPPTTYPYITISAWVQIDGSVSGSSVVASFDGYEGGDWPAIGYVNGGDWFVQTGSTAQSTGITAAMSGGWHLVTAVFQPSEIDFYYDGTEQYSLSSGVGWSNSAGAAGNLTIGYDAANGDSDFVKGEINEVNVWISALSTSDSTGGGSPINDFTTLYDGGTGITAAFPQQSGLIASYPLEGGAGDATGNGNDGTLFGNGTSAAWASYEGFQHVATFTMTGSYDSNNAVTATDVDSGASTTVTPAVENASSTTLTLSSTMANEGDDVTLTATVAGSGASTPTGTVQFFNGTTRLGTAALDDNESADAGVATLDTTTLPPGTEDITAVYSGDSGFAGSSTAADPEITVLVPVPPLVTSSDNPATVDQSVQLTAALPAVVPGEGPADQGSVAFDDNGNPLGSSGLTALPGEALSLSGGDSPGYIALPDSLKFTSGDFTVSFWYKPNGSDVSQDILQRGMGYNSQTGDIVFHINYWTGNLEFDVQTADGRWLFGWDIPQSALNTPVQEYVWNHVLITRSGNTYSLWVNGQNVGSQSSDADISDADNTNPFRVGAGANYGGSPGGYYDGSVDELDIFNRAVSDAEIQQLYGDGDGFYGGPWGPTANGLLAGYHFDGDASDYSGNGYNGTVEGTVSWTTSAVANSVMATYNLPSAIIQAQGTYPITAVYTPPTGTSFAVSTSDELDQEIDPDFNVTGPGAATPGVSDPAYTATILPDANNDPAGGTMTFTLSQGTSTIETDSANVTADAAAVPFTASLPDGTYTVTVSYASSDTTDYPNCTLTRTLVVAPAITPGSQPVNISTASTPLQNPDTSTDPTTYYDWTYVSSDPSGLPAPAFSDNDDATAYNTTATFSALGQYTILASEATNSGIQETTTFTINVDQGLTSFAIAGPAAVAAGGAGTFSATALDQFGNQLTSPPTINWTAVNGDIDSSGTFTAAGSIGYSEVIASAMVGETTVSNFAVVQIVPDAVPIEVSGDSTVNANMPYMLNLPTVAPSGLAITGWSIIWGDDGTNAQTIGGSPTAVPHVYGSSGYYSITATATDYNGASFSTTDAAAEIGYSSPGAAGAFDPNFADDQPRSGSLETLAALPDDTVVAAGTHNGSALLRAFNPDGTFDLAWSPTYNSAETEIRAVAVQSLNGSFAIVSAGVDGSGNFYLDRNGLDGSYDYTFASNFAAASPFTGQFRPDQIAVAADGSIYVAGYLTNNGTTDLAVAHYNSDGSLDTSFGAGGGATAGITADSTYRCGLSLDQSGNIVVAGTADMTGGAEFAIARFAGDGTLDSTFGDNGVVLDSSGNYDDYATAVAIQSDGGIVVAGYDGLGDWLDLVRYLSDGTEDPNFQNWNASGISATAVNSIVVQPNNQILVGGAFDGDGEFGVARFNVDGSLDSNFNNGAGYVTNGAAGSAVYGMVIQPDGGIVAAGISGDPGNPSDPSNVPLLARLTAGDIGGTQIRVDNVSPALPLSGDSYVAAGDTYTLTLGSPLPPGEGQGEGGAGEGIDLGAGTDVSYTVNWNDGTAATTITADDLAAAGDQVTHVFPGSASGNTVNITVDVTVGSYTNPGVGSLSVVVDSNTATTTNLTVNNSLLVFGDSANLTATVAADVAELDGPTGTVEFYDTINGETIDLGSGEVDRTTGMATLTTPPLPAGFHNFTAVYSGDDFYQSGTSAAASARVNGPPVGSVYVSGDSSVAEGTGYTLDLPTTAGGYSISQWSFNWGDNTGWTSQTTHTYGAPGTYTISAIAVNSQGYGYNATLSAGGAVTVDVSQSAPGTPTVTVDNAQYSGADTEDGGSIAPDQLHVSFTGPASQESYTVTINWGAATADDDGTTSFSLNPGQTSFDYPLPQYTSNGTYPITVTVTDADGNTSPVADQEVIYSNSAPSGLTLSLDQQTVYAGDTGPTLSGSFTDPQWNIAHVVTIDWGDGSTPDVVDVSPGETTFQDGPHFYATASTTPYNVNVTVTGMDGTTTADTSVNVTRLPSEVMVGATTPVASEYYGTGAAFAVTCGGGSAGNVTVNFSLSGAVYGAYNDYTLSSSADLALQSQSGTTSYWTITMPGDGPTTATIVVSPNYPGLSAASKTVTFTFGSGTGYNVVSGWSTATATINYDAADPDNRPDETGVNIACYTPAGSQVNSESALVGDFIPVGLGVDVPVANPTTVWGYLSYPNTLTVSYTPNGPNIGSGSIVELHATETMVYVSAADPGGDQANDEAASGDLTLQGEQSSTVSFAPCSVSVDLEPLQLYRDSVNITGGTPTSAGARGQKLNVDVGEQINLSVSPAPILGVVGWAVGDDAINSYIATVPIGKVIPFFYNPIGSSVSYAWVNGGTHPVAATVVSPFGDSSATATFDVTKPNSSPDAVIEHYANTLKGTGYFIAAPGVNGFNMFFSLTSEPGAFPPWVAAPELVFGGVPSNAVTDRTFEPGITFLPGVAEGTGFQYAWVQVIHYSLITMSGVDSDGNSFKPPPDEIVGPKLDNWFPYAAGEVVTGDDPRVFLPSFTTSLAKNESFDVLDVLRATMWLICKPLSGGNWIPLASVEWAAVFGATGTGQPGQSTDWKVRGVALTPSPAFVATSGATDFPEWLGAALNPPGENNTWWETRPPTPWPGIGDLA